MKKHVYLKLFPFSVVLFSFFFLFIPLLAQHVVIGAAGPCEGNPKSFAEKKLITSGSNFGRPGKCMKPKYIIMHTTASPMTTADEVFNYFNGGAGGRAVASQFAIGKDGKVLQMVEFSDQGAEVAHHIANYNSYAVGIEMTEQDVYNNKGEVPPAQYQAALKLVQALMAQYKIPKGDKGAEWKAKSDTYENPPTGVYGHFQLNPSNRSDPGNGFMKDFLNDLGAGGSGKTVACVVTKVGEPQGEPKLPPECQ